MRIVPRRSTLALIAAVVAALAAPAVAAADEGQIIVKYAAGADAQERADARADADVVAAGSLPLERTEVVAPEGGTTVADAVTDLERSPDVAYAEVDQERTATAAPAAPPPGPPPAVPRAGAAGGPRAPPPPAPPLSAGRWSHKTPGSFSPRRST